jgi:hypothetical protein
MFCTNCGKETQPKGSACTHCGFDLTHVIALLNAPDDTLDEVDSRIRPAGQIASRALTLAAVTSCTAGRSKPAVIEWLKKEKLWRETTPLERRFLLEKTSPKSRIRMSWKIEALAPLLWATNRIRTMPGLNRRCDVEFLNKAVVGPPQSTRAYISSSSLRKEKEIRSQYERVYEAHWKVRDAQLKNRTHSKRFDPEVVYERHYGFNWLIGYRGQPWDDVTADT